MKKHKIVVALGGNAILTDDASSIGQQKAVLKTAQHLVQFIEQGNDLIISHGNGPQVGNLLLQQAAAENVTNPALPLDTCVAMTQGSIGYWLQNALNKALAARNIEKDVATVVTQVIVDEQDPAFENPTKPIGPFLSEEKAKALMATSNDIFKEDAGRGWRKVVPSPKPIGIKEYKVIDQLVESGVVTISAGGGGIPVVGPDLRGVEAVIDKDFASEKLAELVGADLLIILTNVENVYLNYNKPDQTKLEKVRVAELETYIEAGHFAAGSMLPKVEAAITFVENTHNGKAIITSLENIENLIHGVSGTVIVK